MTEWFLGLATSPAGPYLLVAAFAVAFAATVLAIRIWLDRQETKVLAGYRGHVPPHPIPRPHGMVPPRPWPAATNPAQRPLHTAQVPPAKDCCGACDGSQCATAKAVHIVSESLARMPIEIQTRRKPHWLPKDKPYLGSYYGEAIDQILNSEATGPTPEQSAALDRMAQDAEALGLYGTPASSENAQ